MKQKSSGKVGLISENEVYQKDIYFLNCPKKAENFKNAVVPAVFLKFKSFLFIFFYKLKYLHIFTDYFSKVNGEKF